jgi:prolyl-tRNA editing enzyme YbaK/EbsC (Cys-tRNA(Pro) deacylase)
MDKFKVLEIDPNFTGTAEFCEHYSIAPETTANCVIVEASRGGIKRLAVVVMLASTRADLNTAVRKLLDARRVSLAPKDTAVELSRMEYGSITAIGLPAEWPLLIDARVMEVPDLVMGGGLVLSKLRFPGRALAELPQAQVIQDLAKS